MPTFNVDESNFENVYTKAYYFYSSFKFICFHFIKSNIIEHNVHGYNYN